MAAKKIAKKVAKSVPVVTDEERGWVKENNGSPCDMEELAERAEEVHGRLGQAAQAFLDAQKKFKKELARVGYEHG